MEPKKSFTTAESTSVGLDDASFNMDPPLGRCPAAGSPRMRRRSQTSLPSESRSTTSISCVSREDVSGEDCARHRFIVWAAVKRNRSVRMAASERLTCPLLRCGERFEDHENMLRHLSKCPHLSTGEYVCYECMKVERFNDRNCRCCLGHPTKRKRIINMAKHFFSNIGSKSRRDDTALTAHDDMTLPPPSYDSLVVDTHQQYERQEHRQQQEEEEGLGEQEPQQPHLELNGTEILELDSRPLLPAAQLDSVNYDPQSTNFQAASSTSATTSESLLASSTSQYPMLRVTSPHHDAMPPPNAMPSGSGGSRPSLALDTHVDRYRNVPRTKYLSPSSSLRSTKSSQGVSPITPWSSSSGGSAAWTMGSSIDTTITSPTTPFSPSGYPTLPQPELRFTGAKDISTCPGDSCDYSLDKVSELPGDDPLSMPLPRGLSDPLCFSFDPKDNYSWMSSVDTEISLGTSVNMMFTDPNPANTSSVPPEFLESPVSGSETKTIVNSAWEALQVHISHSMSKLTQINGNPLAERLKVQTPRTVALSGLSSFKKILDGKNPTDPLEYLSFVHVIFAFSLILYEEELSTRCNNFYNQALAYGAFLNPAYSDAYCQIVTTIWQPDQDEQAAGSIGMPLDRSSSSKGKEAQTRVSPRTDTSSDPLVAVAQNFLDDIENSVVNSDTQRPIEVLTSELWSTHVAEFQPMGSQNSPFAITANYIIHVLGQSFHDSESLVLKLKGIEQRVNAGCIANIRKLELEILQAGKISVTPSELYDDLMPQVRGHCDQVYSQQGFHPRSKYHMLGISLVETLLRGIAPEPQQPHEGGTAFSMDIPNTFDEFLETLDSTFEDPGFLMPMNTEPSAEEHVDTSATPIFGRGVDPNTLHRAISSAQMSNATSRSLTTTASHPETPSGSFPVSSVPSPDLPRAVVVPSSPASVAPTDNPGSSSSAQKVEANDCCEICGYRPKGDPQWFKGSMAKHKKMQHSAGPPIIYKCPFPGCSSQYKNRQDNLRQHQIEKNHFVGDERPPKRKKRDLDP